MTTSEFAVLSLIMEGSSLSAENCAEFDITSADKDSCVNRGLITSEYEITEAGITTANEVNDGNIDLCISREAADTSLPIPSAYDMVVVVEKKDKEVPKVKKGSKKAVAQDVFDRMYALGDLRKDIIKEMVKVADLTKSGASTYYQNFKKAK
jgi:hypothetical protein